MTGIAIPLLIHWWRTRQGKVLPIASIRFLNKDARAVATKRKLQEWLLLAIRCLLIILAATWLAKPVWNKRPAAKNVKGWILVPRNGITAVDKQFPGQIDSLIGAGYELHAFEKGFSGISRKDSSSRTEAGTDYFNLLDAADRQLPQNQLLQLYTDDNLAFFNGDKPTINRPIKWQLYSGTQKTPAIRDSLSVHILIYAGANEKDADYLAAALRALKQTVQSTLDITVIKNGSLAVTEANWLFWLSAEALPENIRAENVLAYDSSRLLEQSSWMVAENGLPGNQPALFRRNRYDGKATGSILWRDGFGDPLLWSIAGQRNRYLMATRFDPAWNDLVWSASFPEWMAFLIAGDKGKNLVAQANTAVQPNDLLRFPTGQKAGLLTSQPDSNFDSLIWIIFLLLFFSERIIAHRVHKNRSI